MDRSSVLIPGFIILILVFACFAGCSDSSPSDAGTTPMVTTTSSLYAAGDIVKNPKSTGAAVLIIGYDPATDMYERAYIYPNTDGSWGYRLDSKTLTMSRTTLEKMYTQKIKNVAVTSIKIGAPTTATTVPTTIVTTPVTTVATTVTLGSAPRIKDISPDRGTAGTTVSNIVITGQYFVSPANVSLVRGSSTITATSVKVDAANQITCSITIPASTTTGYWDILVTNPDKQNHRFQNGFNVMEGTTTTTTTTTTSSSSSVTISSVLDNTFVTGGSDKPMQQIRVLGTNLNTGYNMKLSDCGGTIDGTGFTSSSTSASAFFTIPGTYSGYCTITIVDSNNNVLASKTSAVEVRQT